MVNTNKYIAFLSFLFLPFLANAGIFAFLNSAVKSTALYAVKQTGSSSAWYAGTEYTKTKVLHQEVDADLEEALFKIDNSMFYVSPPIKSAENSLQISAHRNTVYVGEKWIEHLSKRNEDGLFIFNTHPNQTQLDAFKDAVSYYKRKNASGMYDRDGAAGIAADVAIAVTVWKKAPASVRATFKGKFGIAGITCAAGYVITNTLSKMHHAVYDDKHRKPDTFLRD